MKTASSGQQRLYPELGAGGFTHVDGTVEFYQRINSLLRPEMTVLDFGAGRGKRAEDGVEYRRQLSILRGKVQRVIGADIDDAVLGNPSIDEAMVLKPGQPIPLADGEVDVVVSDFTFEHVADPGWTASELTRILRPGGWMCARTPNRWGYIGASARLVPNCLHVRFLRMAQPEKAEEDTFPTTYRLNTLATISEYFPSTKFESYSYCIDNEPAYFGNSLVLSRAMRVVYRLTPSRFASMLYVFMRKTD